MINNHTKKVQFRRSLLAMSIIALGSPTLALAQESDTSNEPVEEVVVLGVKGAQQSAINVKRDAATIVDGIAAEDIGKLPDATVTDSLQRITGVQIQRQAGEGGALSIRGMSQVALLLNGEQYLAAGNLAAAQPDLGDVPAQLLHGSQVYKSLDVRNAQSGITGTINIQTYRPLDFKEGFSAAGGLDVSQGELTQKNDPTFNALLNWRNDAVGIMVSGVTGTKNLANDFAGGAASNRERRDFHTGVSVVTDSHGFQFFNEEVERDREGLNAALQADLGNGFEFVAEAFYTHAKSYDRQMGLTFSNRWLGEQNEDLWLDTNTAWHGSATGIPTHASHEVTGKDGTKWITADEYDVNALWVKSYSINNVKTSDSKNFNFELNYDNDGPFTGSLRAIKGKASSLEYHANGEGDFSNWQDQNTLQLNTFYPANIAKNYTADPRHTELGVAGGYYVNPNPQGYGEDPQLTLSRKNHYMTFGGFDTPIIGGLGPGKTLRDYMANKYSQAIGSYALEGNDEIIADLNAYSLKGKYTFEDEDFFITDVEVGLRQSNREIDVQHFHMFSPFYVGSSNYATSPTNASVNVAGCMAQWKAIDQQFQGGDDGTHSQCSAGERLVGQEDDPASFTPYTVNRPTPIDAFGAKTKLVKNLGSHVKGIPDFWAIDPRTFDNPVAFHNKAFGGAVRVLAPATSYAIELEELSSYLFGNFKIGNVSGNLGVRVIDTTLTSHANSTSGVTLANGDTTIASGKVTEEKTSTEVLPALNLAVGVTDDIKIRFAAAKTKQELDLFRYGSSLGITTAPDPADPGVRIPSEWSSDGNVNLKPWLATNFDLSAEYYVGDASLVSLGVYHIKIDSFVDSDKYFREIPINGKVYNLDGRGPIQGKGGKVEGIEVATKIAFSDFTSARFITDFGIDANYTYSPSEKPGVASDITGKAHPFADNSEDTYNLVVWYQKEKLQARVALNRRSDRFIADDSNAYSFALYELGATYVDVNVSYDFLENVTVYAQGSNVTSTDTKQVFRLKDGIDQDAYYWDNEARYSVGVRAKF